MYPLETISQQLTSISESKMAYIKIEPSKGRLDQEVPDFTVSEEFRISVFGSKLKCEFGINKNNLYGLAGVFDETIFKKDMMVFTWNLKPLFSYFRFFLDKPFLPSSKIVDLKVFGNLLGSTDSTPENLTSAINRFKKVMEYKNWKRLNSLYQNLHVPLILSVLPNLETTPILNKKTKGSVYAYYEIEGQKNGRLRNYQTYQKGYVPHTMGQEVKEQLEPRGRENIFLYSDINNCEVSVLQWLSGDKNLERILESSEDVYSCIYSSLTNDTCNTDNKRKMCKKLFLPVMYGCGVAGVCENLKVGESTARELIKRIQTQFSTAIEWIISKQKEFETNGVVEDYHGRPRSHFEASYKVRNFVVQSPAATVCLEKLVAVVRAIEPLNSKVVFTVHDGYGIVCNASSCKDVFLAVKNSIAEESKLCPGLRLAMHAQFGRKLIDMQTI